MSFIGSPANSYSNWSKFVIHDFACCRWLTSGSICTQIYSHDSLLYFLIHFHIIALLAWPPLFLTHANTNTLVFTNTGRSVWNTLSERVPEAALSRALLAWATLFVCELNYGILIMQQRVHLTENNKNEWALGR